MTSDITLRDGVKNAYRFDTWPRSESELFDLDRGRRYLPDHMGLRGFRFLTRFPIANQRHSFVDTVAAEGTSAERYEIWIRQHSTPREAHESLIDFLATCMAVRIPTLADAGLNIGDIGFGGGRDPSASIVFARGSVFVRVDAANPQAQRVAELADAIDSQIRQHFAI